MTLPETGPTPSFGKTGPQKKLALAAGLVFVLAFLAQGIAFIRANSQTFDEAAYLGAGYSYLTTGDFRLSEEHPPLIKELSALPVYLVDRLPFAPDPELWNDAEQWKIGANFLYHSSIPADRILFQARLPNLCLGAILVGLVGWWAYRLWGAGAAVLALGMAAFDPNLVAHSSLLTFDLGLTLFTFLTFYLLWEYVNSPSPWLLAGVGVSLGLDLAAKLSAVFVVPILLGVIGLHVLGGGSLGCEGEQLPGSGDWKTRLRQALGPTRRILLLALLTLPLFYLLYGFPAWARGLRFQMDRQHGGAPSFFFLGQQSSQGWWLYYPAAILIKTPLGTLVLILAALGLYWMGRHLGRREATFLLVPPLLFLAAMMWGRVDLGVRYVLPVYPFLFVAGSRVATFRLLPGTAGRWVTVVLAGLPLLWTAASSVRVGPHQLAYFNELVGGPEMGYRYLSDSNVDWGQDLKGLKGYMDQERLPMIYLSYFGTAPPASYGIRSQYLPGFGQLELPSLDALPQDGQRDVLAISVVNLQGIYLPEKDLYRWLSGRTPVARIGYSIFVYDLTGDAEAHLRLAEIYLKMGPREWAASELDKVLAIDPANPEALRLRQSFFPASSKG